MNLHVIYTESEMLLSKKPYASWREIQDEFATYTTSLGPWTAQEVLEYLRQEHPQLVPSAVAQVQALVTGACETVAISPPGPSLGGR